MSVPAFMAVLHGLLQNNLPTAGGCKHVPGETGLVHKVVQLVAGALQQALVDDGPGQLAIDLVVEKVQPLEILALEVGQQRLEGVFHGEQMGAAAANHDGQNGGVFQRILREKVDERLEDRKSVV